MSRIALISFLLSLGLVGCGGSDDSSDSTTQSSPVQQNNSVSTDASGVAAVSVAPPPTVAAPPAPGAAPAPIGNSSPTEANGEVSMNEDGVRLEGEALLRKAMMQHVEGKGLPYPERIEELVEKGTLKSLPPAPVGKKWAIDPSSRQIVLQ